MIQSIDKDLVAVVGELGPLIAGYAEEAERERRPPKPMLDALAAAGLYRLFTPGSLGGLEVDPVTFAHVIEEVSGIDSVAGWSLMVGNSADWWCAHLPTAGAEELYADDRNAIIAAAFHPPMQATTAPGGYRVSGRGPLASFIHDATWLFVTALVTDGSLPGTRDGAPQVIGVICRAQEAEILDTWHALGMRGTDSNDVVLSDVFVPASRTFPLGPEFAPGVHHQGPLYRFPAMGEVAVVIAPVCLAVARGGDRRADRARPTQNPVRLRHGAAGASNDSGQAGFGGGDAAFGPLPLLPGA